MSDETGERKKLTVNDPVPPEVIQAFDHIEKARARIAIENMALDQRKIQLLAAAKKVDEQFQKLFDSILVERGLPLDTVVEIDDKTGVLTVQSPPTPPAR